MNPHLDSELIVCGAGLVGASYALLMAETGLRLSLIETSALPRRPQPGHPAALALNRTSYNILHELGIWQQLPATAISPYTDMQVWDEDGTGQLCFSAAAHQLPCLGHVVREQELLWTLHQRVLAHPNIHLLPDTRPVHLELGGNGHIGVLLEDGRRLHARLLAGADGAHSNVRRLARIESDQRNYGQHTLSAIVHTELPHRHCARQRFRGQGALALLPLADPQQCLLLWSDASRHIARLQALEETAFGSAAGEAFGGAAGGIRLLGQRLSWPLRRAHARHYQRPRLALLGDAAHSIHPLAGLGANLGLLDAACLAQLVGDAWQAGKDIGKLRVLRRYERWRRPENAWMMAVIDGLKGVFGNQSAGIPQLRRVGMHALNRTPALKRRIIDQALGPGAEAPAFAHSPVQR